MEVVGVAAAGFPGLDPARSPQIRVPILMKPLMTPGWDDLANRRSQWVQILGRLKPGYNPQSAQASLQNLFGQVLERELTYPELRDISAARRKQFLARQVRLEVAGAGYSDLRQTYSTALVVLMALVGAVLLIACFNAANLLIAKGLARQKDIAMRLALGASRGQLLRPLLFESLLLAFAGGLLGLGLSVFITRTLLKLIPLEGALVLLSATPDPRILGFNLGVSLLTGLIFGVAPAWQALRVDHWNALHDAVGAVANRRGMGRLRAGLVVAQIAFSFVLVAGAVLFSKTLSNLRSVNPGFTRIGNLVTFQVDPALNGYDTAHVKTFYGRVLQGVRTLPGTQSAGFAMIPLLSGRVWEAEMSASGHTANNGEDTPALINGVSPGFCATMGLSLLEGRDFDERDVGKKIGVAIVSRKFAQQFFGGQSAVGRRIGFGSGRTAKLDIEVVGVVEDSLYGRPRDGIRSQIFVPFSQIDLPYSAAFYIRTPAPSEAALNEARRMVSQLDPALPVYGMKTLDRQVDETLSTERLIATLSTAYALLATALAGGGLYAVTAFAVARRAREIGLRMALGAARGAILWRVVRGVLAMVALGLAAGIPGAYWLGRYAASQLFGVASADPGSAGIAVFAVLLIAAAASFAPALRASATDPMLTLRQD
jgi:predicted permease